MALTEFGKAVRKLRIDHGYSMLQMAKEMGVSNQYLSQVETGQKKLTADYVIYVMNTFPGASEIDAIRDEHWKLYAFTFKGEDGEIYRYLGLSEAQSECGGFTRLPIYQNIKTNKIYHRNLLDFMDKRSII